MEKKIPHRFFKLILAACLIASVAGGAVLPVRAQASIDGWSEPVNLSKSGQTLRSFVIADSSDVIHTFWLDRLNGMVYSRSGPDGWSEPREVEFPIGTEQLVEDPVSVLLMPELVSGPDNWVYLFWQDSEGLNYTANSTANGRTLSTWSIDGVLARSSASYDAVVDAEGVVHVAYLQPTDSGERPAGVYYIRLVNWGTSWSAPVLLYGSSYYRNLAVPSDEPLVDNSVDLSVTTIDGEKAIFVAFDNQPRKSVFVTRSLDGGDTWEEASQVDGPEPGSALASPGQIHVDARGEQVLLTWEAQQSDTVCFTYYRNSDDGGATWNANRRIYTPYSGCADQLDFLTGYSANSLLVTSVNGLSYLNAWDGESWSGFLLQSTLSSFIDRETQENVAFTSSDWTLISGDQFAVIGNDRSAGGDTWLTTRSLADVSNWFSSGPGWKISPDLETLSGTVTDLQVIGESGEALHAFWVQAEVLEEDVFETAEPSRVVYYSSLVDNQWTEPVPILRAPRLAALSGASTTTDDIASLAVASAPDDRLWAVWKNSIGGEVYFSWARASAAKSVVEWSEASLIATIPIDASEFSIAVDRGGWIHIAYSVPLNEGRGLYLVHSGDQGKTWSNAVQIFDGQSANWDRVALPSLAAAPDGSLWVLFCHQSAGVNQLASGLYAAHSADRGATWSAVETVSAERVLWSKMLVHSVTVLHRLWLEQEEDNQVQLFHQVSNDGGKTWERVVRVSNVAGDPGPTAAVIDRAGQVHLTQVQEDQQGHLLLRYWLWNGSAWSVREDEDLGSGRLDESKTAVALAISPLGQLGVVASRSLIGADAYRPDTVLVGFNRPVNLPEVIETSLPPLVTETSAPQPQVSETPQATPTIDLATLQQGSPTTGGGTVGGLIVAVLTSLLVIGGGVVFAIARARKRNGG